MDEAFGFTVGGWGVWSAKAMLDALLLEEGLEAVVTVAGIVVGEHAAAGDAKAREVGARHVEEQDKGSVGLVGQDGGEGDATVVIDGDMQVLITGSGRLASVVAMDAMAGLDDACQPFDIEVDQVAGSLVLITHHRRRRVQ